MESTSSIGRFVHLHQDIFSMFKNLPVDKVLFQNKF